MNRLLIKPLNRSNFHLPLLVELENASTNGDNPQTHVSGKLVSDKPEFGICMEQEVEDQYYSATQNRLTEAIFTEINLEPTKL